MPTCEPTNFTKRLAQTTLDDATRHLVEPLVQTLVTLEAQIAKIAVVALARKLAGVLWAMWRDGTVYDRAWQAREHARGVRKSAIMQNHRASALERAAMKLRRSPAPSSDSATRNKTRRSKIQEVHSM